MNEDTTVTRGEIEAFILQQIQNEIRDAILLNAPESWSQEKRDAVADSVMDNTRLVLAALSTNELQSAGALRSHIAQVIADTKRIIHQGGVPRVL